MLDTPASMVYHLNLLINPFDKKPFFVLLSDTSATRFSYERCLFEDDDERRLVGEIIGEGPFPELAVLESIVGRPQAMETKRFWIAFLMARRIPLFNKVDGWIDSWRFERMHSLARYGDKDSPAVAEQWFVDFQPPPLYKTGEMVGDQVAETRRKYPRAYEPWGELEDAFVKQAIEAGITPSSIAAKLQRQRGAVASRIRKQDNPE